MSDSAVTVQRGTRVHPAPRVSVVIPAWLSKPQPGMQWLDEALDSVRAQTLEDWEIIVVDDGSPVPIAPSQTDDIVLVSQPNTGPGGARNRGATHARGEFIAYIDADDRWRPGKLARQVEFMDANPGVALVCTDMAIIDGATSTLVTTVRAKGVAVGDRIPFAALFHENCVGCATAMVRREMLARTPGMHPSRRLGEDFGLWLRIGLLGEIGYIEEALLERRRHDGSLMSQQYGDGSWLIREREVYEEFLAENPQLRSRPFVHKALARLAFQGGWMHLVRSEWQRARPLLLSAVRGDPGNAKAWLNLARAFLRISPGGTD